MFETNIIIENICFIRYDGVMNATKNTLLKHFGYQCYHNVNGIQFWRDFLLVMKSGIKY